MFHVYAQVYIRLDIEIAVGLLGQYSIVEYARNQELQLNLKIHLPLGGIYLGLIFAKCVDIVENQLQYIYFLIVKRLFTEDAINRLQLLHLL
jgi:hypothetical protein